MEARVGVFINLLSLKAREKGEEEEEEEEEEDEAASSVNAVTSSSHRPPSIPSTVPKLSLSNASLANMLPSLDELNDDKEAVREVVSETGLGDEEMFGERERVLGRSKRGGVTLTRRGLSFSFPLLFSFTGACAFTSPSLSLFISPFPSR